ncbi:MAG TPA: sensor domain-containing protein [Phytomonospora sp.]
MSRRWRLFSARLRDLALGGATGLAALLTLPLVAIALLLVPLGIGVPLVPEAARLVRRLADTDRRRVGRVLGEVPTRPYTGERGLRAVLTDPATRHDLAWLVAHAVTAPLAAFAGLGLCAAAANDLTMPLWWWAIPGSPPSGAGFPVDTWARAAAMLPIGLALAVVAALAVVRLPVWQARLTAPLLRSRGRRSLAARLAEVTASRAAALEAHGTELRRIERDLHDGTQNRLIAVLMHLGLLERAARQNPDALPELIARARTAVVDAVDGLREVIRGIYPPVLDERGLDGAVAALAAGSPVPAEVDTEGLRRAPAAVESAAYFIVAEALTNVARHSGATRVSVRLRHEGAVLVAEVEDDGRGGAGDGAGGGLPGIRRRAEALDGTLVLHSPPGGPTTLRIELPCA